MAAKVMVKLLWENHYAMKKVILERRGCLERSQFHADSQGADSYPTIQNINCNLEWKQYIYISTYVNPSLH